MKKLRIIALISIFAFVSADSFGGSWYQEWRSDRQQKHMQGQGKKKGKMSHKQSKRLDKPTDGDQTGAPIDGGLLTLLAASGLAIYGTKKKKKTLEN